MTDGMKPGQPGEGGWQSGHDPADAAEPEGHGSPHRVIGTPPPAEARTMLAAQDTAPEHVRELPADPDDPVRAKKVERLVAAIFTLAFLAGCGFIASYVLFTGHTLVGVQHSNMALGGSLALVLLLLGIGTVIWVRHLMPAVELTEERHPLRSTEEERAEFKETFEEGAEASQFVKRPLLRRTLMLASLPLAAAPLVLLRDLGPLPHNDLD